jgi:hypothetical protein
MSLSLFYDSPHGWAKAQKLINIFTNSELSIYVDNLKI